MWYDYLNKKSREREKEKYSWPISTLKIPYLSSNRLKNSLRRKFDFISLIISTVRYWFFALHFDSFMNYELMRWRKENWKRKKTSITTFLESSWGIIFACIYIYVCWCALLSNFIFNHAISRRSSTIFSSFLDSVIMVFTSITYTLLFTMGK